MPTTLCCAGIIESDKKFNYERNTGMILSNMMKSADFNNIK